MSLYHCPTSTLFFVPQSNISFLYSSHSLMIKNRRSLLVFGLQFLNKMEVISNIYPRKSSILVKILQYPLLISLVKELKDI